MKLRRGPHTPEQPNVTLVDLFLASALVLSSCALLPGGAPDAAQVGFERVRQSVSVGSTTDTSNWESTWEDAAISEAERLHPGLTDPRASRFPIAPEMTRVRVIADGGYCAMFGGLSVDEKWRANEIEPC